ncbi:hypothetical protein ACO22_01811 [Paracoccidioides brasiliensis]|uniref:SPIN90/Ldb17 leucine-rich domain-containing protein n=1 Tax=Paracoccidioides brasiliensis TaxID=121759 RepID=A0A1D2JKK9_PARBR|nr:hypothetical protein ACO22_01811 [Paracoccidioides brasiliensis]
MELEASYNTSEDEKLFWDGFEAIFHMPCDSHAEIDNVLRAYLQLTTQHKDTLFYSKDKISQCSERLIASELFIANADYIRRQIIYCVLQDDAPDVLFVTASFLLFDGRQNEHTFEMMNMEGAFVRLLELIQSSELLDGDGGAGLHQLLMNLIYEMCRIQRIKFEDLVLVDDDFIKHLYEIIEKLSDDAHDPYHYSVIRVLLVLNEQFMVSAHDPLPERSSSVPLTNKVIKILSTCGSAYKTFGENIILLLNRESETSLQLLTLKLLYLLFTTPPTYEYFYTNDLRVLVDILIRNLLDLPEEAAALRHTYLRVLYPLLAHTQLRYPPHYKREELKKLLGILVRGQFSTDTEETERILHFDDVDETTKRLVFRCGQVEWLNDPDESRQRQPQDATDPSMWGSVDERSTPNTSPSASPEPNSPHVLIKRRSSQIISNVHHKRPENVGMNLETARSSSASVVEVAAYKEKPGVKVPSRKDALQRPPAPPPPKHKPEPPKTRRWRGRCGQREEDESTGRSVGSGDFCSSGQIPMDEKRPAPDRKASGSAPPATTPTDSTCTFTDLSPTQSATPERTVPTITVPKPPVRHHSSSSIPPAVPPPRRSSHSVPPLCQVDNLSIHHRRRQPPPPPLHHPHGHSRSHHSQSPSPKQPRSSPASIPGATSNDQTAPQKPEPPKTRRWRGKKTQQTIDGKTSEESPASGIAIASNINNINNGHNKSSSICCEHQGAVVVSLLGATTASNQNNMDTERIHGLEDGMAKMKLSEGG